ncbi:MAG: MXAN_5187 C-terminal domain-containing protein [Myxococcota bacterium]
MAKVIKEDLTLRKRLEELDRRLTVLKIQYDKYFSGLERIEPLREREELRRMFRDLMTENISNSRQRFLFQNLRARYNTMEMYFTRNLVMIERGTHPKMQFRAAMRDRQKREAEARIASNRARQRNEEDDRRQREDRAYSQVFERYIAARKQCGQSTDLDFEAVKKTLKNQVRMIKSRYRCESVKFRITVEEGKARLKAIPKRS